jgi:hypothetical protein
MKPVERLTAITLSITVFVILFIVDRVVPILAKQTAEHSFLVPVIAFLTAAGTYRILGSGVTWLFSTNERLRSFVLGPSYMHGTWIGWFRGHTGELRFMVEHFDQDFDSLVISGRSFTSDEKVHGYWSSEAVLIDPKKGELVFTYIFDVITNKASTTGVHKSRFERKSARKPPTGIAGFAHDLNDPTRIAIASKKISDELVGWEEALSKAKSMFNRC